MSSSCSVLLLSDTNMSVEWWYTIIGLESLNSWCIHMVFWSTLPQHCLINTSPTLSDQRFPNIVWSTLPQHCLINTSPTLSDQHFLNNYWLHCASLVFVTSCQASGVSHWCLKSVKTECDYVCGLDFKMVTYSRISPKVGEPQRYSWEHRRRTDVLKIGWNFLPDIRC